MDPRTRSRSRRTGLAALLLLLLALPASGAEQLYVSASRGRESCTIYSDDRQALRQAIRRSDTRLSALDLLKGPQPSLRSRLRQHLIRLRRAVAAEQAPEAAILSRTNERTPTREMAYER